MMNKITCRQAGVFILLSLIFFSINAAAQSSKRTEYGANLTVAIYQFDDTRSKAVSDVTTLKQTVNTADEEAEYITRTYGVEDLKPRHVRSVGLAESESFTDAFGSNDKPLTFTIIPRRISRDSVSFDFKAAYDGKTLLEKSDVTVNNYETVMLRGGRGEFGIKQFQGPKGLESIPDKRALLVTITPTIIAVRGLQNRPSDLSRPTDQYGAAARLSPDDVFIMPSVLTRVALKFSSGSAPKGQIVLEGVITPDGRVTNVKVLESPDAAYNARAIEVFRQYKFTPAMLNGKPTWATWRETFVLSRPEVP
ncbi:MAG: energy transducer TonB [Blastocatellia bacterium]